MTVTNHMMTGAVIAAAVQRPLLAIPLAFLSHFAIDMLPHYGYGHIPPHLRDKQKNFLAKQTLDTYFALALFWLVPYMLRNHVTPVVTALCMLASAVPDFVWAIEYIMAQPHRRGTYRERSWFTRLHKAIQWCERTWGIYVELAWFAATVLAMRLVTL